MAAELGCNARYTAHVVDQGGQIVATLDNLSEIEWYRVINDTSTGRAVAMTDAECCERLGRIRSWRHSLEIFRSGVFVWSGPVIRVQWRQGSVEILANDFTAWLARRVPHSTYRFDDVDMISVAETLIDDAFLMHDPGHQVISLGRSRVSGARTYYQGIGHTLDWLVDLSENGGLDFTSVGQQIILLPDEFADPVGRLSDTDLPEGLTVTEDGTEIATRWHVYGRDGSGVYGVSGGIDPYYGLIERSVQDDSVTTDGSAEQAARARVLASSSPSVFIDTQEVTLSPEAGVDVSHLIPGWTLDVTSVSTCRDITDRLKITGVHARDSDDGERLSVQVGPLAS